MDEAEHLNERDKSDHVINIDSNNISSANVDITPEYVEIDDIKKKINTPSDIDDLPVPFDVEQNINKFINSDRNSGKMKTLRNSDVNIPVTQDTQSEKPKSNLNTNNGHRRTPSQFSTTSLLQLSNNLNTAINIPNKKLTSDIQDKIKRLASKKKIVNRPKLRIKENDTEFIDTNMNTDSNINTDESDTDTKTEPTTIYHDNEICRYTSNQYHSVHTPIRTIKRKNSISPNSKNANADLFSHRHDDIEMDPTKLINEHLSEIQLRILGHRMSASIFDNREQMITFPITILATFIASSIMIDLSGDENTFKKYIKYTGLIVSFALGLLNELRKYFNYAEAHKEHDLSAKLYTTLLRSIEVRLIKQKISKEEKQDIFKDIINQMSIIEQYEPDIPGYIDTKVRDSTTIYTS